MISLVDLLRPEAALVCSSRAATLLASSSRLLFSSFSSNSASSKVEPGIRHMVLEKAPQLTQHPQAHYINNRTMEVFRGLPGLSAAIQDLSPPLEEWRRFIYCESMAGGQALGEVDHFPGQTSPHDPASSPEPVTHLSQHRLLPLLLQQAQQSSAAAGGCADIRFGSAVTAVSMVEFPHQHTHHQHTHHQHHHHHVQGNELPEDVAARQFPVCVGVTSTSAAGGAAGPEHTELVRCSYLAAADGAHSTVRQLLGIPLLGQEALQHLMSIHFSCPALGQALLDMGRAGMLYFAFNRQVVAVLVAHDLGRGEFVAQVPYFPPLQSPSDFTPELCQQLIAAASGWSLQQLQQATAGSSHGLRLHSVKSWQMSSQVAAEYTSWGDRVLLLGDSAHKFPPAGGFGMNTGLQDAHNLAWKLAAVVSGTAMPALLASYQLERRPIAEANATLSVSNWHEAIKVPQVLGLDPAAANLASSIASAVPLPAAAGRVLLDTVLAAGRTLAAAAVPLRGTAVQEVLRSGQSLRLQFPREDLGFVYTEGAVSPEQQPPPAATAAAAATAATAAATSDSRGQPYVPCSAAGSRLPHCWLQLLGPEQQQGKVSTLDLVLPGTLGLNMLLICSSGSSSLEPRWLSAGLTLQQQGWPVKVLQLLLGPTASGSADHPDQQQVHGCSQQLVAQAVDVDGTWAQLHQGWQEVAVLVRPDGHVAWRRMHSQASNAAGCSEDNSCVRELLHVLKGVLQLSADGSDSGSDA